MKKKQWTYTDLFIATSLVGFFTAIILWIYDVGIPRSDVWLYEESTGKKRNEE